MSAEVWNWAEREMVEGYMDGRDLDSPEPSENRSRSYRHGFRSGRNDLNKTTWGMALDKVTAMAEEAIATDMAEIVA